MLTRKRPQALWLWLAVPVIGLALWLAQNQSLPAALPRPTASPATEPQTAPETFLPEYDPQADLFETGPEQPEPVWQTATTLVLKLGLVLGLVYVSMAGLRWLKQHKVGGLGGGHTVRVLETTGLGPNQALHLVVVGDKTLLIGATPQQLSLISELTDISVPLPAESLNQTAEFETLLSRQQDSQAWQSTLGTLRSNLHNIRESLRVEP
ncbi:MAG TPA: flagellar biosynthetic protein FliO [Anaerolineae bacterium]|nr:flagellar biosynthetic protein FliO [Anaerolineae bacterium]HMR64073.1 flagellar biosynthetic protein FliO [Anaerolineae bacterium]